MRQNLIKGKARAETTIDVKIVLKVIKCYKRKNATESKARPKIL